MRTTIPLTRLTILPHSRDTKVPGTPMRYRSVLPEILQALHRPFACGPIPASCRGLTLAVTRETMKFIEHRQSPSQPRGRIARCESCTGRAAAPFPLGAETSTSARVSIGANAFAEFCRSVLPGTAGTCRATVRNPGALCGRLGAGVVAYVPRYGAYVTLSRAPRETALFPVHCSHSSLPGRYASAAYTPVCGGTTGNMPRIPGGGVPGMLRYVAGRPRRTRLSPPLPAVPDRLLEGLPA